MTMRDTDEQPGHYDIVTVGLDLDTQGAELKRFLNEAYAKGLRFAGAIPIPAADPTVWVVLERMSH